jgi:drug/metabolite transporter (DMT)-like permease
MIQVFCLVVISEFCSALGQIFFKKSANQIEAIHFKNWDDYRRFLSEIFRMKAIWWGFVLMGIGLVVWLMALTGGELSFVYPVGSVQYVLVLVLSGVMLNEKIDSMKILGTGFVIIGLILIGASR